MKLSITLKSIIYNIIFVFLLISLIYLISLSSQDKNEVLSIGQMNYQDHTDYIGYLIIPKIKMQLGFYEPNNPKNNVNQNIEVLKNSQEGRLFIAGHSGVGKVSFFNDLRYLTLNDEINIIYQNKTYSYLITDIYKEIKDGDISVKIKDEEKVLVLTTCDQITKGYQLIIKAILIE